MTHYKQSPKLIHMQTSCCQSNKDLKKMNIEQRWNEDNRIPTWTFGLMNFNFDINFIQNGGTINNTDDFVLKILGSDEENNIEHDVIATRKINYNGNWFKQ